MEVAEDSGSNKGLGAVGVDYLGAFVSGLAKIGAARAPREAIEQVVAQWMIALLAAAAPLQSCRIASDGADGITCLVPVEVRSTGAVFREVLHVHRISTWPFILEHSGHRFEVRSMAELQAELLLAARDSVLAEVLDQARALAANMGSEALDEVCEYLEAPATEEPGEVETEAPKKKKGKRRK